MKGKPTVYKIHDAPPQTQTIEYNGDVIKGVPLEVILLMAEGGVSIIADKDGNFVSYSRLTDDGGFTEKDAGNSFLAEKERLKDEGENNG